MHLIFNNLKSPEKVSVLWLTGYWLSKYSFIQSQMQCSDGKSLLKDTTVKRSQVLLSSLNQWRGWNESKFKQINGMSIYSWIWNEILNINYDLMNVWMSCISLVSVSSSVSHWSRPGGAGPFSRSSSSTCGVGVAPARTGPSPMAVMRLGTLLLRTHWKSTCLLFPSSFSQDSWMKGRWT